MSLQPQLMLRRYPKRNMTAFGHSLKVAKLKVRRWLSEVKNEHRKDSGLTQRVRNRFIVPGAVELTYICAIVVFVDVKPTMKIVREEVSYDILAN